ncbi:ATP-binding cassette subfamily B protein [Sporomusaceae bacterium BoRhaA]|uniref:ABC transporter ATP-binding protein n=1 Tax=Pelorhabdus rhamnosifermentans TaxID=2772457 RepID=UPI001C062FBE|nr:ABC transporter ATP-binding protein [Pelorhabdus rhamnosifermentans]MBU2704034.1 ATP-binding cassette subfamily B protein [Pelorhabdus rhamnosifermentans]
MNKRFDDRKMIRILWNFAAPFTGWGVLALLIILAGMGLELSRPYLMKIAIDTQIAQLDLAGLRQTAFFYGLTIAASVVLSYGENYILQYIGQFIIFDVRQKVFRHLIYQRYRNMEKQKVGQMVTRVTNDTDALKDLYTDVLVAFASDFLILFGIVFVMLLMDWQLAVATFVAIPLMIFLALVYQKYARNAYRQIRQTTGQLNSFLQENLNNISVVKAFARFRQTEREFETVSQEYLSAGLREVHTFAVFRPLVDFIYTVSVLAVLWVSGLLNEKTPIQVGIVVAFLRYVEMFFWPIKDLAEKYTLLQSALAAAERISDILDNPRPEEEPENESLNCHFAGAVRFEHVWFAYQAEEWVLKDVSFSILAGQFVGVVGSSGSGKSTLMSLLSRFYDPQCGTIYLDDVDIRLIPLELLRRKIGVVFQDVQLFKGTVRENLTLYDDSITPDVIEKAAQTANAHLFIVKLPLKYETPLGYQGALLSAGQRQLLSLARVLVLPLCILVLDEATSSIDSETEALIQGAFEKIVQERTMLVIAHRLSTIEQADQILVMDHGRLREQGTHETLLKEKGFYARLYDSQVQHFK